MAFFTFYGYSQTVRSDYQAYIEQYRATALQHQQAFGIPASITLAQGLLESRAGKSGLAKNGNNHFGIKDFNWRGETLCYGDSSNMHCYRKYGAAEDSFLDHAKFLKSKRYGKLYELEVTDYRSWAQGLLDCGYAEDPAYPQKLIGIIEQYRLNELDALAIDAVQFNNVESDEILHSSKKNKVVQDDVKGHDNNETKAAKRAKERAEKLAAKKAKQEAREKERQQRDQEKKEREQQLKQQREAEKLAYEREKRAQRERQRRERAERYAERHATAQADEAAGSARRNALKALRAGGNGSSVGFSSADND